MTSATRQAESTRELSDVVNRLRRALRRSIRSEFPWEMRPIAQFEVLQTVADGAVRVGDLAARLRLAQSTVSSLVGKLVDEQLISRAADPADRRASVLTLTAAGRRELRGWDTAHRRRLDAALHSLTVRDRDAVLRAVSALDRLVDAVERDG